MATEPRGELVPVGGGDPIPLVRDRLTLGRRSTCDIKLDFANVSGLHCELVFRDGYWLVRDLGSTNGIKVNGEPVMSRPLRPGDEIAIAKRRYTIQYQLPQSGMDAIESLVAEEDDMHSMSLLEKAGLQKPRPRPRPAPPASDD